MKRLSASSQLTAIECPADGGNSGNVDPILYNDLVEILPLVQSLIDTQPKNSFTRRGAVTYTKTPSRRTSDSKEINTSSVVTGKPKKDEEVFAAHKYSSDSTSETEIATLREKVEDLQSKLVEKEGQLKSAEEAKGALDELKNQSSQKDTIIKSKEQLLSDAKIMLADKTAALEKIQWELRTIKRKANEFEEELANVTSIKWFVDELAENEGCENDDYDVKLSCAQLCSDPMDQLTMLKMEEAKKEYLNAIEATKNSQDDRSLLAAAQARIHFMSFLLPS